MASWALPSHLEQCVAVDNKCAAVGATEVTALVESPDLTSRDESELEHHPQSVLRLLVRQQHSASGGNRIKECTEEAVCLWLKR